MTIYADENTVTYALGTRILNAKKDFDEMICANDFTSREKADRWQRWLKEWTPSLLRWGDMRRSRGALQADANARAAMSGS